jgi:hypothetical protein
MWLFKKKIEEDIELFVINKRWERCSNHELILQHNPNFKRYEILKNNKVLELILNYAFKVSF